jgi:uncharacterized lipoprotein YddW (UPF0748 family)
LPTRGLTAAALGAALFSALSLHASTAAPAAVEVRGLWVLRTSLASRESIASMVRAASLGGFNTLLVQVRGRGEAFYRSDLEPRASELDRQPAAFDPLATVLDLAHAANLRVHVWINVNLVASSATLPRSREHVALRHPEWLMAPRALASTLRATPPRSPAYIGTLARWTRGQADQFEGLFVSPALPAAREYTTSVVREIVARYDVDGVHLDYIRFPGAEFDYSPAALAEFRAAQSARVTPAVRAKLDGAAKAEAAAWADAYPNEWTAFRQGRMTDLVRTIGNAARQVRPDVTVSAAVVPALAEAREHRLQDWLGWARDGLLDVVCPMIYTTESDAFATAVAEITGSLGETPVWAGIGAYRLPLAGTIDHVRLARRRGADGVLLFSYDKLSDAGTHPASFTALRPVLLAPATGSGGAR